MAEIPIERKQSRNWLPLLLLGLLLLAILGYYFLRPHSPAPVAAGADSTRATPVAADTTHPAAGAAAGAAAGGSTGTSASGTAR